MRRRPVLILLLVAGVAAFVLYLWGARHVPAGQAPLTYLRQTSLEPLRADFNAHADKVRIVALLSPTCSVCLQGASAVQDALTSRSKTGVRVLVVWEPILITDIAPPISMVLGRMSDPRVRQFWDADHLLSEQLKKDARAPQPVQECCDRRGHLWDLAAVYPVGATWTDRLPTATVFNGPVVDIVEPLTAALTAPNR